MKVVTQPFFKVSYRNKHLHHLPKIQRMAHCLKHADSITLRLFQRTGRKREERVHCLPPESDLPLRRWLFWAFKGNLSQGGCP